MKKDLKHIQLFESATNERGLAEIEIEPGMGMVIYNGSDAEFMQKEYENFSPNKSFEKFVQEMTTPGIYGRKAQGGPWEVVKIESKILNSSGLKNIYGLIYRF